jgi:hypothetical protein
MASSKRGKIVGKKFDAAKLRWDLVPWRAMKEIVKVLMHGAKIYGEHNWKQVDQAPRRYWAASMRHAIEHWLGQEKDEDTALSPLAHQAVDILFLLEAKLAEKKKRVRGPSSGRILAMKRKK